MGNRYAQLVRGGELLLLLVLGIRSSAAIASPEGCEDLLSRLPHACDRYAKALVQEGRTHELTRPTEAWMDEAWILLARATQDSLWTGMAPEVVLPDSGYVPAYPADTVVWGRLVADTTKSGDESHSCLDLLAVRFHLPEGPILFTIGRSAEFCSEVPTMIFEQGGRRYVQPLPEIWDHNVEALWCTGRHLVMNLRAEYEYGSRYEGLAFWNLESGWIRVIHAMTRSGLDFESKEPIEDPAEGLGVLLRDLSAGSVREEGDRILVKTRTGTLAFRPMSREWSLAGTPPIKP